MFEEETLKKWSIQSNMGYSLKRTPSRLTEAELEKELLRAITMMWGLSPIIALELNSYSYATAFRIKALHSALMKVKRHPNREMKTVFNDLLGIRIIAPYSKAEALSVPYLRKVDMREGKKNDDGYRGIHFYYQQSNQHYPIEIQWWDEHDKKLNNWLHENSYKLSNNNSLTRILRERYDARLITESEFEEVYDDLRNS